MTPLTCYFSAQSRSDVISMTHHVECVAILEPAAKGLTCGFARAHYVRCGRYGRYLDAEMTLATLI